MNLRPQNKTIGLKVISVIFAVLLWLYVANHGELTTSRDSINVQLQYRNLAEGFSIKGPESVEVKLWGNLRENRDVVAYADMTGFGLGSHRVSVKLEPVSGVILTSVKPNQVEVLINKLKEETLPVKYLVTQSPPAGYELLDIITVPDKCILKGEETALKDVAEVVADVKLGGVKEFTSLKVPILAKDAGGRVLSRGIRTVPEEVLIYAVVGQVQSSKQVKIKTTLSGVLESEYQLSKIETNVDHITILGNKAQTEGIVEISTHAIDLNGKKESFSQDIDLILPTGIKAYPTRVLVHVEIKKNTENEVEE
ncbi:MAG: CdaR family protein [Syntrophomonadaceae bacterium]|nr:CdaR family protein [Syntrophomonadaceae bacterium]MDD3023212.1 CdaR family protein [Syntrophomonadaceae bacterium]